MPDPDLPASQSGDVFESGVGGIKLGISGKLSRVSLEILESVRANLEIIAEMLAAQMTTAASDSTTSSGRAARKCKGNRFREKAVSQQGRGAGSTSVPLTE
jgi:hypothetical protein